MNHLPEEERLLLNLPEQGEYLKLPEEEEHLVLRQRRLGLVLVSTESAHLQFDQYFGLRQPLLNEDMPAQRGL